MDTEGALAGCQTDTGKVAFLGGDGNGQPR
jgi:hypothetical protein